MPTTVATMISAGALADQVAAGEPVTVLDVRDEAGWGIEGPGVRVLHVPAAQALTAPAEIASGLSGPVAVVCNRGVTARPVARALRDSGVDARSLQDGMRGWIAALQARRVPLGLDGVVVLQVQRPGRGCLSYLFAAGGEALVVDPAPDAGFYESLASGLEARITDVVDTHLHADHLSGARVLAERSSATLRLPAQALERGVAYADRIEPLSDGDAIAVGGVTLRALALPGHTTDMTGLLVEGLALVSGDSLFADGIARPDLQRGDADGARAMAMTLHATLHERVLPLGDDVVLLPGHTHPGVNAGAIAPALRDVRAAVAELAIAEAGDFAEALLGGMPPRPARGPRTTRR
jgi:glyoxylase-like metal-dependent hydrolase (beta-lactamase superfamily II)